jgi:hypothetical protein
MVLEDVCMSEDTAPAAEPTPDATGPGSDAPAGGDAASAGSGDAPGAGGDAQVDAPAGTPEGQATPAQVSAAYKILNREFRDQKHAEEVLGAEVGRARGLQKSLNERDAEIKALRELLARPTQVGPGQVQGSPDGKPQSDPKSFADELANSGELELLAKIAQDPEMGIGHAMYAMAQAFDKRLDDRLDQFRSDAIDPVGRRVEGSEQLARAFSAVESLTKDFPELLDYGENAPPEVQDAQARILDTLSKVPPEWLANNPKDAIWFAVKRNREQYGTPVIANQPGTSGSPSAMVAAAAEKASAASASIPLDGPGVPPQGERTGPETLTERWRREASHLPKEATSPSGRKLGFPESA